jgi:hypothetical protein
VSRNDDHFYISDFNFIVAIGTRHSVDSHSMQVVRALRTVMIEPELLLKFLAYFVGNADSRWNPITVKIWHVSSWKR